MISRKVEFHLKHKVRFITAASLFDGHDAAINIMRRVLQGQGAEVIHLGHDRSVGEIVDAAIQEDAQGIAVSSYQGGHVEYFTYMVELLRERGAGHIRVYGGGGGVIVPDEIKLLHERGVARIFSPEDGQKMGLEGMIRHMLSECDRAPGEMLATLPEDFGPASAPAIARALTTLEWMHEEKSAEASSLLQSVRDRLGRMPACPVVGFTGTGGAGKSSLLDEVLLRFLDAFPQKRVAVLCVDPSRRRSGGALLGDRIRANSAARSDRVFFRSMATRQANASVSPAVKDSVALLQAAGFDLVLLETAGIGQSDSAITELAGITVYVMTPEFGAPSQLEKIDMLDFADFVTLNKFDKQGAEDALREVRKAYQRNRKMFDAAPEELPIFATAAHRFRDPGTHAFFNALFRRLRETAADPVAWDFAPLPGAMPDPGSFLPRDRVHYLHEVSRAVHAYHSETEVQAAEARAAEHCYEALRLLGDSVPGKAEPYPEEVSGAAAPQKSSGSQAASAPASAAPEVAALRRRYAENLAALKPEVREALRGFDALRAAYEADRQSYEVRGRSIPVGNFTRSLSESKIPKVRLPQTPHWDEQVEFLRAENAPGRFPFTAGVFPFKRENEDPTRMFAGEGMAERTNARFHLVSRGQPAVRLSTAFDSVTLYGADPHTRPDIYGKVGNSGVSVCCLDDAKRLYSGFDLCAPTTSVSMTINGPAPMILAYFFNTAVDAACERWLRQAGKWDGTEAAIDRWFRERGCERPRYRAKLPDGHDGSGLGFLGLPADAVMDAQEYARIRADVLKTVRGTVQADILKEDQAQNTCIFSTEFALRLMGDVQQHFIDQGVRNFYSVSISGYHIAEAGANPITQLALTLANGFTYVEYYRARGMDVNAFAPNLSFFFSNGLDPEYGVIGRVARRIWALAMKSLYGADERSQKLKYHIQTSGRSLHAQEVDFNDIRTTLQALLAINDNCNSLHTNAYDEAITTPTEASVRRAIAIQLIINRELGVAKNENPLQGSYFYRYLTDLVEREVLRVFDELDARGGVMGAMETNYQRSRIQEESLHYERKKLSGELPIIGVNTFLNPNGPDSVGMNELIRSTDEEKKFQVAQVEDLKKRFPAERARSLDNLKAAAKKGGNLFGELMETAKYCSLGSITGALFEVGGAYRRNA